MTTWSRRRFLKTCATTLALLPLATRLGLAAEASPLFDRPLALPGPDGLFGALGVADPITMRVKVVSGVLPGHEAANCIAAVVDTGGKKLYNPSLVAKKGDTVRIKMVNELPVEPTILHWHGLDADWTQTGEPFYQANPGGSYDYEFPILNRAGTYWYHSHAHMFTAPQVYYGLAGFFIVSDDEERAFAEHLDLKLGETDIPLVIQEKRFSGDGQIDYQPTMRDAMMGYLGGEILINDTPRPYLDVSSRLYRLRLLNGTNARPLCLAFTKDGSPIGFHLVGTDGGLLSAPQRMDRIMLACGERAEVLVDLREAKAGEEVFLETRPVDGTMGCMGMGMGMMGGMGGMGGMGMSRRGMMGGMGMGMMGAVGAPMVEGPIMKLRVARQVAYDRSIPERISQLPSLPQPTVSRPIVLAMRHAQGTINGLTHVDDATPIVVSKRQPEVWEIYNAPMMGGMIHPLHTHGYQFRVLSRQGGPAAVRAQAVDDAGRLPTDLGWKDTVAVWPGELVRVGIDFTTPYGPDQIFMVHCHILEHEDRGMMLNFKVV